MPNLNQMELQELRHLIGAGETAAKQFGLFAQNCNDPQLRSFLEDEAVKAAQNSRNLMGFLQT
ncbi:MAG: hypothetical protein ACM3X6_01795 [Patescibacteria group bacterium]